MKIERIPATQLSPTHIEGWRHLQNRDQRFASPFFSPEFTLLTAQIRKGVCVSIAESDSGIHGYFPFEEREGKGAPVGSILSDYHGVVISPDTGWSAEDLVQQSGLDYWTFRFLIESQSAFRPYHQKLMPSHVISLEKGFSGLLQTLQERGSHLFQKWLAGKRRISRDIGRLRYEFHVSDPKELQALLNCKSLQYQRTGATDIFHAAWTRELLERIHATQEEKFAGVLSVLYAGDTAIAWHMGMRSQSVLHYWFPCYCAKFASFSPGFILLLHLLQAADEHGLKRVDLGAGNEAYKLRLATSSIAVAQGVIA
jgi:CelD/BcsL family acetyltransferase involved in cellulose biosynthesis